MRLRRALFWLILIGLLVFVFIHRREIKELLTILQEGKWQWLLPAILLQVAYYPVHAFLYVFAFAVVGVESRAAELLPVLLASIFIDTIAPSAGTSGAALFIDDAVQRGQSGGRTAEGILLVAVAEHAAVLPLLLFSLIYLLPRQVLPFYEALGIVLYLLLVAVLTGSLFLASFRPDFLESFLWWLQRQVNHFSSRLRKQPWLSGDWAKRNADELKEAAKAILVNRRQLWKVLAIAWTMETINLLTLAFLFLAFGTRVGLGVLLAGYTLGFIFAVISILPYDIGLMQAIMALVYISLGVAAGPVLIVVLAFGGLNAWLPILIGFFLLRRVRSFGGR